jgi:hypothetical protein
MKKTASFFSGLFLAALLGWVYTLALTTAYLYHDDFLFWAPQDWRWSNNVFLSQFLLAGRPVGAFIKHFMGWRLHLISDANFFRYVAVFFLFCFALVAIKNTAVLCKNTFDRWLMSIAMITLPSCAVFVCWMITFNFAIVIFLASVAFLWAYHGVRGIETNQGIHKKWLCFSVALNVLNLATYQPAAMVYWAWVGFFVLGTSLDEWPTRRKQILIFLAVGLASLTAYGVLFAFIHHALPAWGISPEAARSALTTTPLEKLHWFFYAALPLASALHGAIFFPQAAFLVLLLSIAAIVIEWNESASSGFFMIQKWLIVLTISFFCLLPNLVVQENALPFRILTALEMLCLGAVYLGLSKLFRAKSLILMVLVIAALFQTKFNVDRLFVQPRAHEINYIRNFLKAQDWSNVQSVYVVRPPEPELKKSEYWYNEFLYPSCYFEQDIPFIVRCALKENGFTGKLEVTSGTEEKEIGEKKGRIVLDMRKRETFRPANDPLRFSVWPSTSARKTTNEVLSSNVF